MATSNQPEQPDIKEIRVTDPHVIRLVQKAARVRGNATATKTIAQLASERCTQLGITVEEPVTHSQ
jgi:hypothetical protein